jgi:DNA repair protein RecO (recombination protein O)
MEAIVVRVQPFAESDRLATLLSAEHGRVRAVARGAQKGRSTLSAAVQPFVRARMLLWHGRQLDGVAQAEILDAHGGVARDVGLLAAASYCCDLADAFSVERQEAGALYGGLSAALDLVAAAAARPAPAVVLRWFELSCLGCSGFLPELAVCTACGAPVGDPQGRSRLSASGGGILCDGCSGTDPHGLWLSPNTLRGLRYLAGATAEALARVRVGPGTMAEMDAALAAHIGAVLQRPLRSRALLQALT